MSPPRLELSLFPQILSVSLSTAQQWRLLHRAPPTEKGGGKSGKGEGPW